MKKKSAIKKKSSKVSKKGNSKKQPGVQAKADTSEPIEWYTITNPEQVKLLTNDLRLRILIEFAKEELTAKQVAERLGEPPTKFYRHVSALAKHGLIVPTREEKKRGTIQQFYRSVAKRFRIDDTCFSNNDSETDSKVGMVIELLNTISAELSLSSQSPTEYVAALTSPFLAPESKMEEVGEKLFDAIAQVFEEFKPSHKPKKTDKEYRISLLIHPTSSAETKKSRKRK